MEEHKEMLLDRSHDPLTAADSSLAAGNHSAAVPVRDDRRRLIINSLLVLAVAIPALLRCSGGDQLLASWSLSLFAVSYLFYCMCFFSTTATTPLSNIFVALFYVGLLAFFVRSLLSNVLGMVIMYLDSAVAAGLFGAILAQHRQSNGTEKAAIVAAANARAIHMKPEDRGPLYFMLGFIALCCAPFLVWLMLAGYPAVDVAESMFLVIVIIQIFHISCVLAWLNIGDSSVPVFMYFALVALVFIISRLLMGEIVGVTVLWLCILASTAFLGYYQQIHASYQEIMSSEPATEIPPLEEILVV